MPVKTNISVHIVFDDMFRELVQNSCEVQNSCDDDTEQASLFNQQAGRFKAGIINPATDIQEWTQIVNQRCERNELSSKWNETQTHQPKKSQRGTQR